MSQRYSYDYHKTVPLGYLSIYQPQHLVSQKIYNILTLVATFYLPIDSE